jgi:hypothetical protein
MPSNDLSAPTSPTPVYGRNPPLILWSTQTHFKFRIQQDFLGGRHYVWCSPEFDGAKLGKYTLSSNQPASSDPATIYRQLRTAIKTNDQHDAKIAAQKATISALAQKFLEDGVLTTEDRDEILAMLAQATVHDWRPLILVIPFAQVEGRAKLVDRTHRASHEPEYIIPDLVDGEFRIIEPEAY